MAATNLKITHIKLKLNVSHTYMPNIAPYHVGYSMASIVLTTGFTRFKISYIAYQSNISSTVRFSISHNYGFPFFNTFSEHTV